jgi:group I intron endonuclease
LHTTQALTKQPLLKVIMADTNSRIDNVSGVYEIKCTPNGKIYIGSSHNCRVRMVCHMAALRRLSHVNQKMQMSYNKYGKDAFSFRILASCPVVDLLIFEQKLIDELKPFFNIALFAGAPNRGRTFSESVRAKVSKSLMGNKRTLGYRHTTETLAKFKSRKRGHSFAVGNIPSEETRAKLSKTSTGRVQSEKSKEKTRVAKLKWWADKRANDPAYMKAMSDNLKNNKINVGRKSSPERIAKIVAANTGRKNSEHAIQNMSTAAKLREKKKAGISNRQ